jgi:excisionase family DNA binding protein
VRPETDTYMKLRAAAKYMGMSPQTVRRHIEESGLPARRLGGLVMLRRSDIDAWFAAQEAVTPRTEGAA